MSEDLAEMTLEEVCAKYGMTITTIYKTAKELDVDYRSSPRGAPLHLSTYGLLAELLNTDKTLREIADAHGYTHQNISAILQKARAAGIRFPHRRRMKLKE